MRYRSAIFDVDGTLFDTARGIYRCLRHAFCEVGWPVPTDEALRAYIGPSLYDSFTGLAGMDDRTARQAIAAYRARYEASGVYECDFFDGVPELLQTLQAAGVRLSVASSKPLPFLEKLLRKKGIHSLFDRIAAPALDDPGSDKARLIAQAAGDAPAVMVGDRIFDIRGAQACGIDSIGVTYGFAPEGELQAAQPTYLAASAATVAAIILDRS